MASFVEAIYKGFVTKRMGVTLFAFQEVASTNAFAMELIQKNPLPGTLIVADRQTAGRGRLNRRWFSPPGVNIYASLIIQSNRRPWMGGWIPLLSGLAISKAIEDTAGPSIGLKWPNDLLVDGKKVGGILCETATGSERKHWVVIGFGINVNEWHEGFPHELRGKATTLEKESGHQWDRIAVLQKVSASLEKILTEIDEKTLSRFKITYQERCATIGQQVQVSFPDGSSLTGIAQSIGFQGQLQLRAPSSNPDKPSDKILDIHSADITHIRPVEGSGL